MSTEPKRWRKEIQANRMTKALDVLQIVNGYLVTISKYGQVGQEENSEHISEERKFYSKTNPLEDVDSLENDLNITGALASIEPNDGKITV